MSNNKFEQESVRKLTTVGILTALTAVLGLVKIPIMGVSITLVLPVVIIGGALYGPFVGAWLTVIPNLIALTEAGIFLVYAPVGCIATLLLKGLLAGFLSGLVYDVMSGTHPVGAVTWSAVVAPTVNTLVFVVGCYIFIWDELVKLAGENEVGIGLLLFGLAGFNYIIELVLNVVLCPSILRVINFVKNKK